MGQQLRRLLFLFLFSFFATWFCTTIDLTNSDKILVNQLMICKYVIAQMCQANQANGPFVQASQAGKSNRSVSESLSEFPNPYCVLNRRLQPRCLDFDAYNLGLGT